ncbi:hypothetical protein [Nocardioides sp. TF02-7]|uniref:hypothetical protein n=1 Tax=Nocardioides sp. TF02-7 TaxID=2917724 RepID=UPI001F063497|nr:hypothetical protein [Nocardioides sp. TF02-7]UMG92155.1 hypothetical protein MF408_19830 [Nocardioides sp. TF02-7]
MERRAPRRSTAGAARGRRDRRDRPGAGSVRAAPHGVSPHPVTIGLFVLGYGGVLLGAVGVTRVANRAARAA